MKNAGVTSKVSATVEAPATSVKQVVAESFATEKEVQKKEKEVTMEQVKLEDLEQGRTNVKKTAEKKTVTKKTTAKKATAPKVVKAAEVIDVVDEIETNENKVEEPVAEVEKEAVEKKQTTEKIVLQANGREDIEMSSIIDRVKAAYVAEGHQIENIENIEVYIKLNENMVYYVIDGYASGISLY